MNRAEILSPFGIALGGGAARGLCHIGVLKEFSANGIAFPVVAGTSMGAIVGAAYACDRLDDVERLARSVTPRTMAGWADVNLRSGALKGDAVKAVFREFTGDITFAGLRDRGFRLAVVACDVERGEPVYISEGRVDEAVRASMSIPGVFEPVIVDGRTLVDGALVDNVPVEAARRLGARTVIAVDVDNPHDVWARATTRVGVSAAAMRVMRSRLKEVAGEAAVSWQRALAAYRDFLQGLAPFRPVGGSSDDLAGAESPVAKDFVARLHLGMRARRDLAVGEGEGWTALRAALAALDITTALLESDQPPYGADCPADFFIRPDVRSFHAHQFYRAPQLIESGELAAREALPRFRREYL